MKGNHRIRKLSYCCLMKKSEQESSTATKPLSERLDGKHDKGTGDDT